MVTRAEEGGIPSYLCDVFLGIYGSIPPPHRGRDRIVSFLEKRAHSVDGSALD